MKISVIGCGRWGSFIAWYLDSIGHDVTVYGRENSENYRRLLNTRTNGIVSFNKRIRLSPDLCSVLKNAETVVISVDAQKLRGFMTEIREFDLSGKIFVLCIKGIEIGTGKLLHEVMEEYVPPSSPIAVWVGPGHVQEFIKGNPNCMVIDSRDKDVVAKLVSEFSGNLIRFYCGSDIIGTEVGSAVKNVIGIAAGALDALSLSSLKGALMSRGAVETARLIKKMGGNPYSAFGLCLLGDFEATVFSEFSHNRKYGETLVTKEKYDSLAEGCYTAKAVMRLCEIYEVEMPICEAVYDVIYKGIDVRSAMSRLFSRSIKEEFNI